MKRQISLLVLTFALLTCITFEAAGQEAMGVSVGYEYLPYAGLLDPDPSIPNDAKLQMQTWSFGAAYPLIFWDGGTVVINRLEYKRVGFHYKDWENWGDLEQPANANLVTYSLYMQQYLTDRWQLIMIIEAGVASDFGGELALGDFTLSTVAIVMRTFGEKRNFTIGGGIAPSPIPWGFLYVDWNIGPKLNIEGSLPYELTVSYSPIPLFDLSLHANLDDFGFHGNPDRFEFKDPVMTYSFATVGSTIQFNFTDWLHLNVEGGYSFVRNFSLSDGPEVKGNFGMENSFYLKAGTIIGM